MVFEISCEVFVLFLGGIVLEVMVFNCDLRNWVIVVVCVLFVKYGKG